MDQSLGPLVRTRTLGLVGLWGHWESSPTPTCLCLPGWPRPHMDLDHDRHRASPVHGQQGAKELGRLAEAELLSQWLTLETKMALGCLRGLPQIFSRISQWRYKNLQCLL